MVKRWDEQSQAYVEPVNVPMRHDEDSQAYVETTGMAYDQTAGAWEEKWSPNKILYLYNKGDECTDVTGGIGAYKVRESGYTFTSSSVIKDVDSITIKLLRSNGSNSGGAITNNAIDLTNYKKICINATSIISTDNHCILSISKTLGTTFFDTKEAYAHVNDVGIIELDISSVTGSYYVGVCNYIPSAASDSMRGCTFNAIWIE